MLNRLDWKFLLTIIITIAGVAVPVWLWQLDISSKALTLTVKSTADLQPQGIAELDGIQILVDGKPLSTPIVSVLELSNSGSRPVLASDFEGPIQISATLPASIAKAQQMPSTPPSLMPALALTEGVVLLQPVLLNPGDVVRFTLVTANGKPHFSARARIAGVSDVSVSDATIGRETRRYWLGRGVATLLLALYMVNTVESAFAVARHRRLKLFSFATGLITLSGALLILAKQTSVAQTSVSNLLLPMVIASLIATTVLFTRMWKGGVTSLNPCSSGAQK